MTEFKLLCCKLFEQYPLCDYRIEEFDNKNRLNVLIIGSGSRIEPILHEVLTIGQLMDTELDVTVATPNAKSFVEKTLGSKAPYLKCFVRIILNNVLVSDPSEEMRLGTLRVNRTVLSTDSMEFLLEKNFDCSYVLISTGKDEVNYAMAEACAQYDPAYRTMIAYVQSKDTGEIKAAHPEKMTVVSFGYGKTEGYRGQLERFAFNIHDGYSKIGNERKTVSQILQELEDPYLFLSSLEAAVHIRSKLACVGITEDDYTVAARKFSVLMKEKPELIERLSVVEHSRWIMSKLFEGYRPMEDMEQIYRGDATNRNSKGDLWHCCLVPCDRTGKSGITAEDWAAADEGKPYRSGLDALDRMTLNIHRKCGELAASRANYVEAQLETLRIHLSNDRNISTQTMKTLEYMESAIVQMKLKKKTVLPLYRQHLQSLRNRIKEECRSDSTLLIYTLDLIEKELAPLEEYISYKDFKHLDRISVQHIPYVLTHKSRSVLLKLLSNKEIENLYSAWQMEPEKMIFVGVAESISELRRIQTMVRNMDNFISNSHGFSDTAIYTCVPERYFQTLAHESRRFERRTHTLVPVSEWNIESMVIALNGIIGDQKIDFLDVTGGNPMITRASYLVAEEKKIAVMYSSAGCLRNLSNAEELEYISPQKCITVKEMFDISGAVLERSEASGKSDLMMKYGVFWKIASENSQHWDGFCQLLAKAHKKAQNVHFRFTSNKSSGKETIQITDFAPAISALMPMLKYIEKNKYIENISVTAGFGGQHTLSITVNSKKVNPTRLRKFLSECCKNYHPSSYFVHSQSKGTLMFTYVSLNTSFALSSGLDDILADRKDSLGELPPGTVREYMKILDAMASEQLILEYSYQNDGGSYFECSFRFASKDVLACIQKSGTVLEYYIYYSALLDSNFTDVDMGYEFAHSSDVDSAHNEIDVICTKGSSSLFISAKMLSKDSLDDKLNYVLYEIIHLADRFGLNAKAVLAAPSYSQFRYDESRGQYVLNEKIHGALQRGVYVLGEECFSSGKLGQILDNIIDEKEDWCDCVKPVG